MSLTWESVYSTVTKAVCFKRNQDAIYSIQHIPSLFDLMSWLLWPSTFHLGSKLVTNSFCCNFLVNQFDICQAGNFLINCCNVHFFSVINTMCFSNILTGNISAHLIPSVWLKTTCLIHHLHDLWVVEICWIILWTTFLWSLFILYAVIFKNFV